MAEVREVHVDRTRGSGVLPFIAFLLGAIMIAIVALVLINVHWTISWPAGRVELGLKPAITTAATTPAPPATNTASNQ